jgi:hypothetical protein
MFGSKEKKYLKIPEKFFSSLGVSFGCRPGRPQGPARSKTTLARSNSKPARSKSRVARLSFRPARTKRAQNAPRLSAAVIRQSVFDQAAALAFDSGQVQPRSQALRQSFPLRAYASTLGRCDC